MEKHEFIKSILEKLTSKNKYTTLSEVVNEIRNLQFADFDKDILEFTPGRIEAMLRLHRQQAREFIQQYTNYEVTDDEVIFENPAH